MTVITAELFKHISTDGINSANRYFHLDNKFDLYYGLHIAQPDTFRLLIRSGNKPDSVVILPATTKRVTRSISGLTSGSPKRDRPFSISLPNAETAVLTIDQFYIALDDDKSKETVYKQFLDSCFTLIRQNR
ncbi:hypothetical protein BWI97_24970 [Siphonobacter sp. BAB-5405]|nr:hypothetical protein BWI97_24970 [Siphonobacter sp. BAB-5405]